MATDPEPLIPPTLLTDLGRLNEIQNREELRTLGEQLQTVLTRLTSEAENIRRRITELLGGLEQDRTTKWGLVDTRKTKSRTNVQSLNEAIATKTTELNTLRQRDGELSSEIDELSTQVAAAETTLQALRARLSLAETSRSSMPQQITDATTLIEKLNTIFKYQWAELQVANKLLELLNSNNNPDLYEPIVDLVQTYITQTPEDSDFTYSTPDALPAEITDRLNTYKTNRQPELGLSPDDLFNKTWSSGLTVPDYSEGMRPWGATASPPGGEPPSPPSTLEGGRRRVSKKFRTDLARKIASSLKKKPLKPRRNH